MHEPYTNRTQLRNLNTNDNNIMYESEDIDFH